MKAFLHLIKYKLCLAVSLSGLAGYLIYTETPQINTIIVTAGIFLLAAGASALNQYQESEYDSLMKRTKNRPVPSGSISRNTALLISLVLILSGSAFLIITGTPALLLGLSNLLFYNLLYTRLKRLSYLAIIPGAFVGAIPPLIGWTAAGGSIFSPSIIFLALLIFMWQIPHFWLLIIKYNKEYEEAGFKTILRVFSEQQVKRIVFIWISVSSLYAMTYFLFGIELNIVFAYIVLFANMFFILGFYILLFRSEKKLSTAFVLSNIFISFIFILFSIGSLL